MVNVPTGLNNFITKVNDLDVGKLKTVPTDINKLSDLVKNNIAVDTLNTKVIDLGNKIPVATTLIHINHYNKHKKNLDENLDVNIKIPEVTRLVTTAVLNTRNSEVDNKTPDTSGLVTTTVLNTKIIEVEHQVPKHDAYSATQEFSKLLAENFKESNNFHK